MARSTGRLIFSKALMFLRRKRTRGPIMKKAVRGALGRQIAVWRKKTLPEHFKTSAPGRYPGAYRARSPGYLKKRRKRGKGPMVFTGEFRRQMLSATPQIPKKITKTIRVKFTPTPRIINIHGGGTFHDFPRAVTAFSRRDKRTFAVGIERTLKKVVRRELKRGGKRTIKRFTA